MENNQLNSPKSLHKGQDKDTNFQAQTQTLFKIHIGLFYPPYLRLGNCVFRGTLLQGGAVVDIPYH